MRSVMMSNQILPWLVPYFFDFIRPFQWLNPRSHHQRCFLWIQCIMNKELKPGIINRNNLFWICSQSNCSLVSCSSKMRYGKWNMLNAMIEIRPLLELHIHYWRDILKTGCGMAEYLFFHAETHIISQPFSMTKVTYLHVISRTAYFFYKLQKCQKLYIHDNAKKTNFIK